MPVKAMRLPSGDQRGPSPWSELTRRRFPWRSTIVRPPPPKHASRVLSGDQAASVHSRAIVRGRPPDAETTRRSIGAFAASGARLWKAIDRPLGDRRGCRPARPAERVAPPTHSTTSDFPGARPGSSSSDRTGVARRRAGSRPWSDPAPRRRMSAGAGVACASPSIRRTSRPCRSSMRGERAPRGRRRPSSLRPDCRSRPGGRRA